MPQNLSKVVLKNEKKRLTQLTQFESQARAKGYTCIVGVDEAGRGPLAGPVVAAACSIQNGVFFQGINDSKLLSSKQRAMLFKEITSHEGVVYSVAVVNEKIIDSINILQATIQAMRSAIEQLPVVADYLLVDGLQSIGEEIAYETVVQGDRRSQSIAASSIIAKQTRDEIMNEYDTLYPQYGFAQHKGYGTKRHREALLKYGPCPIHRLSFAPLRTASN